MNYNTNERVLNGGIFKLVFKITVVLMHKLLIDFASLAITILKLI